MLIVTTKKLEMLATFHSASKEQMSAPPDEISELLHSMQSCICDVKAWATAKMLKLNDNNLSNTCQSAYRPCHSTETALLKFANDLFLSLIKGNISVLALLDFSSAFDTVDHPILVHRLHTDFGFTDTVLQWSSSYLTDRTHYVSLSNHCSAFDTLHSGVPQGSVLGPILFTLYVKPLSAIIDSHSVIHHSFADDIQLQISAAPDGI